MQQAESDDARLVLLGHLGQSVRLAVLDWLAEAGPSTVSELALRQQASVPQVSNHLRRLRGAGLVTVDRVGRQAVYRLVDERITTLLHTLSDLVGANTDEAMLTPRPFMLARTCFDHLAGTLGVTLFERLVELDAVRSTRGSEVELGPAAVDVLARVGVVPGAIHTGRRRLATACPDATEHRPHLGGALGAALASRFRDKRWIVARDDRRDVEVTPSGRRKLQEALQLSAPYTTSV